MNAKDQGTVMKLNETQISKTLAQFRAQVLAEDHPAVAQFCELFGHHPFFLDASELNARSYSDPRDEDVGSDEDGAAVSAGAAKRGMHVSLSHVTLASQLGCVDSWQTDQ